jgi:hypothetical protein
MTMYDINLLPYEDLANDHSCMPEACPNNFFCNEWEQLKVVELQTIRVVPNSWPFLVKLVAHADNLVSSL